MPAISYWDYNATAPLHPAVADAMREVLAQPLNASSGHSYGRRAKNIVEDTRRKLAEYINCWPQEIIWCASASEANNTIISQFSTAAYVDTSFFPNPLTSPLFFPTPQAGGASGGENYNSPAGGGEYSSAAAGNILISAIEHSSILKPAHAELIPVTRSGVVDIEWLKRRLDQPEKPALISVMAANNETGVLQPIRQIVEIAHAANVPVHTDAVQLFGKMPVDFTALGVDYMTLGFHKCGAPQGIGALIVANGKPFTPLIQGGGQEFNRRAGTENIAALAGLKAWLSLPSNYSHMQQLREWLDELEYKISLLSPAVSDISFSHPACGGGKGGALSTATEASAILEKSPPFNPPPQAGWEKKENPQAGWELEQSSPQAAVEKNAVVGAESPRLPNTSCIIVPHQSQEITLMQADLAGICISAGSACSSGRIEPSHVLTAMGYSKEEAGRAVRISGGWHTTRQDIKKMQQFLLNICGIKLQE